MLSASDGTVYPDDDELVGMEVQHTAVAVSDLDATKAFYEDGLGLVYEHDFHVDGTHHYYVSGEELDTAIQFVHDESGDTEIEPSGIVHLALLVDDVDETVEELVSETGCTVLKGPLTVEEANARAAFVEDPDGYEVELFRWLE
ncbi:VOC family protein [Natranaeroarchaeum aerophilus]|uniref:VOC family protein n=1 Tax=Natranaeroarchaeum aerophilus TaxID=2917711 RepID=A0AAE3FUD1_9EURY|nr:VOC family protein [Natranaeroarchaeum aerophilus]MCL9814744.1 VOC family protein [Natranaeroarchaeum aerophilus]